MDISKSLKKNGGTGLGDTSGVTSSGDTSVSVTDDMGALEDLN